MRDEGIEGRAARWTRLAGFMAAVLALLLAATWWVRPSAPGPLSAQEFQAVLREIDALERLPDDRPPPPPEHATPERIERLFRSADLSRLTGNQAASALLLAGRGTALLQADAPSGVVRAMERWFPLDFEAARQRGSLHSPKLRGPHADWNDGPIVFITLWHCMPRRAWLNPGASPFDPEVTPREGFHGVAAPSSEETSFAHCVRQRSGWPGSFEAGRQPLVIDERRAVAARAEPLVAAHFARHLDQRGCRGTGPDDCALVALLWADLAPADPRLAAALRKIEPEVMPGAAGRAAAGADAGDDRALMRQLLRESAWLKAALASARAAPSGWTGEALPRLLRQLSAMQARYDQAMASRQAFSRFELHGRREPLTPWTSVKALVDEQPVARAAVQAELQALNTQADCQTAGHWTRQLPPAVHAEVAARAWRQGRASACVLPEWEWLSRGAGADAAEWRAWAVAHLADPSGQVHEQLLQVLTGYGEDCAAEGTAAVVPALQPVCRAWITEPQRVAPTRLPRGRLAIRPAEEFTTVAVPELPAELADQRPERADARDAWVGQALRGLGADEGRVGTLLAQLRGSRQLVQHLRAWRGGEGRPLVIELALGATDPAEGPFPPRGLKGSPGSPGQPIWPLGGQRVLLVLAVGTTEVVGIPARFTFKYDEGDIRRVTDIDHDGRPEIWLQGAAGECEGGEDDDTAPACPQNPDHLGEIWGDTLSFFAMTPPGATPPAAAKP